MSLHECAYCGGSDDTGGWHTITDGAGRTEWVHTEHNETSQTVEPKKCASCGWSIRRRIYRWLGFRDGEVAVIEGYERLCSVCQLRRRAEDHEDAAAGFRRRYRDEMQKRKDKRR